MFKTVLIAADHTLGWSRTQATIGEGACLVEEASGSYLWIWWPAGGFPQPAASASGRRSQPSGHHPPSSGTLATSHVMLTALQKAPLSSRIMPWRAPFSTTWTLCSVTAQLPDPSLMQYCCLSSNRASLVLRLRSEEQLVPQHQSCSS